VSGFALVQVDEGALQAGFAGLWRELQPRPGRLANTIRLVALVLITVAIGETFRMPEIAVSAYVVLFVSRDEQASTVLTAVVACVAVLFAVFATIVVFMASLSEPALRVPLIALATFGALFFSRISPLGPAAFAAGFILAYGLTIGDQVLGLSLQSSGVSNTTGPGVPDLLSIPPEEALLQFLLWLAPVVMLPVALVVIANLLTGRRPVALLRAGLADRLSACAGFCAGDPGAAQALTASARAGSAGFAKLHHFAGAAPGPPDYASLIRNSEQLALALLAWPAEDRGRALHPLAAGLEAAANSLRGGATTTQVPAVPATTTPMAQPLASEVAHSVVAIVRALTNAPALTPKAAKAVRHLISAEAVRDPETVRFAFKVTLAVMLSYAAESLLDWPAIHTCVVTCFFVSLGTVGESVHKASLRVTGALIGGALGIGTILLLMPLMTDLGELLLALGAVTLLAGWVACGSERLSYAGWQIGLAYYLTVLQGYGPTLDMQTARDRVIGIVLGNLIVLVVFTTLWPVSVSQAARRQVAAAITQMAALMRLEQSPEAAAARPALQMAFAAASNGARALIVNTGYEQIAPSQSGIRPIDAGTLAELDSVMLVLCVILNLQSDPAWATAPQPVRQAVLDYHGQIADWFDQCAGWVRGGEGVLAEIPAPPVLETPDMSGRAAWYGVLDRQLHAITDPLTLGAPTHG
jgi:multidrug resistance protein MdtO